MIETEVMSNRFIGDGNNKSFAFGFKFNNKNDIQVWLYDSATKQLTKRSDFTLTPNSSVMPSEGGTVTFPSEGAAIPSTQMVIIQRHMNLFQLDVYKHGMFLDLDNFEHSLDTLVMELQQINDSVKRAVKVSIVPDAQQVDPIIPPLEAGQTIMVSEDGKHFVAVDISELFAQTTSAWKAAETSQKWAEASDSPNDEEDSESKTGKTQSSKTWALDSKASQQAALASQNAAKISETNAKASETAAKNSETNADESEANAKASEQAAAESETNAAQSEQAAAESETNAAQSEQAAAESETNAAQSAELADAWAQGTSSPDGNIDAASPTGQTMSARSWVNYIKEIVGETGSMPFFGATEMSNGEQGLVPAPLAGQQDYVLKGDGTWGYGIFGLKRNKVYNVGDIAYSPLLPSWARLECITAGTTGAEEPEVLSTPPLPHPLMDSKIGLYITDGTVVWVVDDVRDGTPIGSVRGSLYLPKGYIKANGATVNRADYPRLVKFIETNNLWTDDAEGNLGLFGKGDGSTTFVLPNYVGRTVAYKDTGAGQTIAAGLPNITGDNGTGYSIIANDSKELHGAFYYSGNGGDRTFGNSIGMGDSTSELRFDASKSNPIYGAADTVQPPAISLIPVIRY